MTMLTLKTCIPAVGMIAVLLAAPTAGRAGTPTIEWVRQLGTTADDYSLGVSADGLGSVYISGHTQGDLDGVNAGSGDAFISKYDSSGALQWTKQLGTASIDRSFGVSADGLGSVYISGHTFGDLDGVNAGSVAAFVSKYDSSGTLQWTKQLGSTTDDYSNGVSADGLGSVFIAGYTYGDLDGVNAGGRDAFISKYDSSGALQWTKQLGTTSLDQSHGVSADGLGNVYISGWTEGDLDGVNAGSGDAFISKYDSSGALQWTKQLGTTDFDASYDVSADGLGGVYISGFTDGDLDGVNAGGADAFVSKYDSSGTLQWTRQFGTASPDTAIGVSADGLGSVYISGKTEGGLEGVNAGSLDAFVSKYDSSGTLRWTRQFGTTRLDIGAAVSADGLGSVYISGYTQGDLDGPNAGGWDAFLAKITATRIAAGDLTNNGFVDFEDLTILLANWNQEVGADAGNLVNADTTPVNFDDLTVLLADWTGPGPAGSPEAALGAEAVPEPSSLLLALLATLGLSFYRRRRRRAF
ncbi:MAG: SBBP repeat-containing protein [Planctomycetes bacterium]|nr:SBBP repeat-containing protein [Planctomycetota bacterium]